jgi:hypothetical protein
MVPYIHIFMTNYILQLGKNKNTRNPDWKTQSMLLSPKGFLSQHPDSWDHLIIRSDPIRSSGCHSHGVDRSWVQHPPAGSTHSRIPRQQVIITSEDKRAISSESAVDGSDNPSFSILIASFLFCYLR